MAGGKAKEMIHALRASKSAPHSRRWTHCAPRRRPVRWALFLLLAGFVSTASAALDELPPERWARLREAERYQLNIAEKYYREQNWKVAAPEYEKFLSLYDQSDGAAYAQLKWSLCQSNLRKLNTAIKDGYQSILDYWPESQEAASAAYLIGKTYKDMGELDKAKKAYATVLGNYPKQVVAVLAKLDLAALAGAQQDAARQVELWKDLAFQSERTPETTPHCAEAARQLAVHDFRNGAFDEAVKALATAYPEPELSYVVWYFARQPLWDLTAADDTKPRGDALAGAAVAYIEKQIPTVFNDDAAKAAARQKWLYVAELQSYARHAAEVGQTYEKMMQIFGVDDDLLGRLAGWFKANNRRDEARRTYARFADQLESQGQLAFMFREEQKWDQAFPIYQDLAVRDAQRAGRWQWELATTYRDAGRYKEAIGVFRQAENFPENLKQMAWCHRQLGEFAEAVGLYRQVMAGHEPSAPWALLQTGYTQEQAKQPETAIKSFQQVCKKFPKTPEASEAHARLQNQYKITATFGGAKDE